MLSNIAKLVNLKKCLIFISFLILGFFPCSSICEEIRVVSLAPVATELIYALSAEESLVAVTDICKIQDGKKIKRLGAYSAVSPEAVFNLHPTLVLVTEGAENQADMLRALGLKVYEIRTSSLELIKKSIHEVAKEFSLLEKGEDLLREGDRRLNNLASLKNDGEIFSKDVLILFGDEGSHYGSISFYGIGQNTFYNDLLEVIGLRNSISQSGYNLMSLEGVCSMKPNCIILATDKVDGEESKVIKGCFEDALIKIVPKNPFLYPGIKYPEIAESIARCKGN